MTGTPRWMIGKRGSDFGVFVSPTGVNAQTAPISDLTLAITTGVPQIIMKGVAAPAFPRTVPHSFGYAPTVFATVLSIGFQGVNGYIRPWDLGPPAWSFSDIVSGSSSLVVSQTGLNGFYSGVYSALNVGYTVIGKPAP